MGLAVTEYGPEGFGVEIWVIWRFAETAHPIKVSAIRGSNQIHFLKDIFLIITGKSKTSEKTQLKLCAT